MNYKKMKFEEFNVTQKQVMDFLQSEVWMLFCLNARAKQLVLHKQIQKLPCDEKLLCYAQIDIIDTILAIPASIAQCNTEAVMTKDERDGLIRELREQMKGDIEQWKPQQ